MGPEGTTRLDPEGTRIPIKKRLILGSNHRLRLHAIAQHTLFGPPIIEDSEPDLMRSLGRCISSSLLRVSLTNCIVFCCEDSLITRVIAVSCPCGYGCRSCLWPVGSPNEITQMPRSHEAACTCGFGCRMSLWSVGSPYEITKIPRSHAATEQYTSPIRV